MDRDAYATWVKEDVFRPTAIVIATATSKDRLRKTNNMTYGELLTPFGMLHRGVVTAECQVLDHRIVVDKFNLQFVDIGPETELRPPEAADQEMLQRVLHIDEPAARFPNLGKSTKWFKTWRTLYFNSCNWDSHETLCQPLAAVLIASATEPDVVNLFEQLAHKSNMPPMCRTNVLTCEIPWVKVVVHDHADAAKVDQETLVKIVRKMQDRYPRHTCHVLHLNRREENESSLENLFLAHLVSTEKRTVASGIGQADFRHIGEIVQQMVVHSCIPWMEKRLTTLDELISNARKGIRNQIKNLWRRPKDSAGISSSPRPGNSSVTYTLANVEGQLRLAADLAFHFGDYELAQGYYKLLAPDCRQDKQWKWAAGGYEMWGICLYLSGTDRWSEIDRCMEHAYDNYRKEDCSRLAIRSSLLHTNMDLDGRDAAAKLLKVNSDLPDSGLRSALLLEQAALCFGINQKYLRKMAFHLVLAGHMFNKAQLKHRALRCYTSVFNCYENLGWLHITDHFRFTMARQAYGLGDLELSLEYFVSLLEAFASDETRAKVQQDREITYLREFAYVVSSWQERHPCELEMRSPPVVESVTVVGNEYEVKPGGVARRDCPLISWDALGELIGGVSDGFTASDRATLRQGQRKAKTGRNYPMRISMLLRNPMQATVELANISLRASIDGKDEAEQVECNVMQTVSIQARTQQRIELLCTPRSAGLLRIEGWSWTLFDRIKCRHPFDGGAHGGSSSSKCMPIEVDVQEGLPVLSECYFDDWPDAVCDGEFFTTELVFTPVCTTPTVTVYISCAQACFGMDAKVTKITVPSGTRKRVPLIVLANLRQSVCRFCIRLDGQLRVWEAMEKSFEMMPSLSMETAQDFSFHNLPSNFTFVNYKKQLIFSSVIHNHSDREVTIQGIQVFTYNDGRPDKVMPLSLSGSKDGSLRISPLGSQVSVSLLNQEDAGTVAALNFKTRLGESSPESSRVLSSELRRAFLQPEKITAKNMVGLHCLIDWSYRDTSGLERHGQMIHTLPQSQEPDEAPAACPLRLDISSPSHVEWKKDLAVKVELLIQNLSSAEVSFVVSCNLAATEGARATIGSDAGFFLTGMDRAELYTLASRKIITIACEAHFLRPGIFNVNKFRFFLSKTKTTTGVPAFAYPFTKLCWVEGPTGEERWDGIPERRQEGTADPTNGPNWVEARGERRLSQIIAEKEDDPVGGEQEEARKQQETILAEAQYGALQDEQLVSDQLESVSDRGSVAPPEDVLNLDPYDGWAQSQAEQEVRLNCDLVMGDVGTQGWAEQEAPFNNLPESTAQDYAYDLPEARINLLAQSRTELEVCLNNDLPEGMGDVGTQGWAEQEAPLNNNLPEAAPQDYSHDLPEARSDMGTQSQAEQEVCLNSYLPDGMGDVGTHGWVEQHELPLISALPEANVGTQGWVEPDDVCLIRDLPEAHLGTHGWAEQDDMRLISDLPEPHLGTQGWVEQDAVLSKGEAQSWVEQDELVPAQDVPVCAQGDAVSLAQDIQERGVCVQRQGRKDEIRLATRVETADLGICAEQDAQDINHPYARQVAAEITPDSSNGLETNPLQAQGLETNPLQAQGLETNPLQAQGLEANPLQAQGLEANPLQAQGLEANPQQAQGLEATPL